MMYFRMYARGRWTKVHYTSDAGLRTFCGLTIANVQAETELTRERRPDGQICQRCWKRLMNDGEVAWR